MAKPKKIEACPHCSEDDMIFNNETQQMECKVCKSILEQPAIKPKKGKK